MHKQFTKYFFIITVFLVFFSLALSFALADTPTIYWIDDSSVSGIWTNDSGTALYDGDVNFTGLIYGNGSQLTDVVVLGETSTTAYRGDRGKIAYDHSQDNSQAHSDYMLNTGDTASGHYELTNAGSIWGATNPLSFPATNYLVRFVLNESQDDIFIRTDRSGTYNILDFTPTNTNGAASTVRPFAIKWLYGDSAHPFVTIGDSTFHYNGIIDSKQSRARAYLNGAQDNVATGWVKVNLDAEDYDEQGEMDLVNHKFVATKAGYYQVNARLQINNIAGGGESVQVAIYKNSVFHSSGETAFKDASSTWIAVTYGDIVPLAATDFIEIYIYHSATATADMQTGSPYTYMSIHKLS